MNPQMFPLIKTRTNQSEKCGRNKAGKLRNDGEIEPWLKTRRNLFRLRLTRSRNEYKVARERGRRSLERVPAKLEERNIYPGIGTSAG